MNHFLVVKLQMCFVITSPSFLTASAAALKRFTKLGLCAIPYASARFRSRSYFLGPDGKTQVVGHKSCPDDFGRATPVNVTNRPVNRSGAYLGPPVETFRGAVNVNTFG